MRLAVRVALLVLVTGLGIIAAALHTPAQSATQPSTALTPAAYTSFPEDYAYFLHPGEASISVSKLNASARLVVLPLNGELETGNPIVNVSVTEKDIVVFTVPFRGFYMVEFIPADNQTLLVSYVVYQRGPPLDMLYAGSGLLVVGSALTMYLEISLRNRPHSSLKAS